MTRRIRLTRHATVADLPKVVAKVKHKKARERATGPSEGLRLCGNCTYWKTKVGHSMSHSMKDGDIPIGGFCNCHGIVYTGKRRKARDWACIAFEQA